MSLVNKPKAQMLLPVIGAPMFIVGVPALVIEQCINGVIGSLPALNARPAELLDTWLEPIESALEAGVDGLILVCTGPGGHAGALSPFALLREVRRFFSGPIALSASITDGSGILASEAMGADFAYLGTRFIATREANAVADYQRMIVESKAADVVYTPFFTGVHGNYLKPSIVRAGLDPDNLMSAEKNSMDFGSGQTKAWKDIWGVGNIDDVPPVRELIARLRAEYDAARGRL